MRVLLDECVDLRLARQFSGHTVKTVPEMGWVTIRNGDLLALAERELDVFITVDRNLSFQLNLPRFKIAVLILRARTNRLTDLLPLMPKALQLLARPKTGEAVSVSI